MKTQFLRGKGWCFHLVRDAFSPLLQLFTVLGIGALFLFIDIQVVQAQACTAGPHSGTISSNQLWCKVDNPHQVTGTLTVQAGVTLTIEPGVQVQISADTPMLFNGSLQAVGNENEVIVFTSSPGSNLFRGLFFYPDSSANLDYVDINRAGGSNAAVFINSSAISIDHSSIHDNAPTAAAIIIGDSYRKGLTPTIQNTNIMNNSGYAIKHGHVEEYPTYLNLSFFGNTTDAIHLNGGSILQSVALDGRQLGGNPFIASGLYVPSGITLTISQGTTLELESNTILDIQSGGTLLANGTAEEPIFLTSTGASVRFSRIQFDPSSNVEMEYADINHAGGFQYAVLINSSAIRISDCNIHDNTPTTAAVMIGDAWRLGLTPTIQNTIIANNSGYAIKHGHFEEYPVYDNLILTANDQDAIYLGSGTYYQNVTLDSRELGGGYYVAGSISISSGIQLSVMPATTLKLEEGAGIFVQSGASLSANGSEAEPIFFKSTGEGILFRRIQFQAGSSGSLSYCDVTQAGSIQGVLWLEASNVIIDHCIFHDTSPSMGTILLNVAGISPTIRDTRILNNSGYPIYQNSPDVAPVYENLTLSGNNPDAVFVYGGSINRTVTWDSRELDGAPYIAGGSFTISTGASLTLSPATELRFPQAGGGGMGLTVSSGAAFHANGTESEPVVITSTGTGVNWSTLNFSSGSSVELTYCDLSQAKNAQGVLSVYTSDLVVDHCMFHDNQPSLGVIWLAVAGINPIITNSTFIDNANYVIYQQVPDMAPYYSNLSAAGSGTHVIAILGGGVTTGRSWSIGRSGMPAYILGSIIVDAPGFLTLDPGTTLQFSSDGSLNVNGGFYALGTTLKPILLTGQSQTPGSWKNLVFNNGSRGILDNVELSFGGVSGQALLRIGTEQLSMQNCKIHHSASDGVQVFNNKQPTLSYNHIFDNIFGLRNQTPTTQVNAAYHWWGDESGPYHTTNPDGLGNAVSDGVSFTPWLDAPNQIGDLPVGHVYIDLVSQTRASPGQKVDYAIWYNNLSTSTVTNAVLVLSLPDTDFYRSSNANGIYWPSRHQVFWVLGDLEPGESGSVVVLTEYKWGIPDLTLEASMAIMLGDGLDSGQLNPADYLGYVPFEVIEKNSLTESQFQALLTAFPELDALYTNISSLDYVSGQFNQLTMSDGQVFGQAVMVKPDISELAFVTGNQNGALAYIISRSDFTLINSSGVIRYDPQTMYFEYPELPWNTSGLTASTNTVNCLANCLITETGTSLLLEFLPFLGKVSTAKDCQAAAADPEDKAALASCVAGLSNLPGVGTVVSAVNCFNASIADPEYCRCSETKWESTSFVRSNVEACRKIPCRDGVYASWDAGVTACPFCTKCVSGTGGSENPWDHCKPTGASAPAECVPPGQMSFNWPTAQTTGQADDIFDGLKICLLIPRDPNAKYGAVGNVVPGQEMTYTVTYENEGEGRAYGVYITDTLDEALDDSTLTISGNYLYIPTLRRIIWFVGELGPKGAPDSKGEVSFTVHIKPNIPGGTAITNQAIVYFPSAPEITPTNAVVNFVAEVTALPQQLETDYMTPVAVTLQGQDVGGAPLTFSIQDPPLFGELTGTPPNLLYTPMENMTGQDKFSYIANNGISSSQPAEVTITVYPSAADETPPSVVWSIPAQESEQVPYRSTPAGEDDQGDIFAPYPVLQFSEALDPKGLSVDDFSFVKEGGSAVGFSMSYDAYSNQVRLYPRAAFTPETWYTVTVNDTVTDLVGNNLTEPYSFQFRIGLAVDMYRRYMPFIAR